MSARQNRNGIAFSQRPVNQPLPKKRVPPNTNIFAIYNSSLPGNKNIINSAVLIHPQPFLKTISPLFSIHIEDSFFFLFYIMRLISWNVKPTKLLSSVGLMFVDRFVLKPQLQIESWLGDRCIIRSRHPEIRRSVLVPPDDLYARMPIRII